MHEVIDAMFERTVGTSLCSCQTLRYVVRGKVMFSPVSTVLFRGRLGGGGGQGTSCPGPVWGWGRGYSTSCPGRSCLGGSGRVHPVQVLLGGGGGSGATLAK